MPELPEVEVTRMGLLQHLPNRRIMDIRCGTKQLRKPIPHDLLVQWVHNRRIFTVERRAKYLLVRMDDGSVLVVHLGMSGSLGLVMAKKPPALHDHLFLRLDNELELRYNDVRRFGMILVWPAPEATDLEIKFFSRIGPEPFDEKFSPKRLRRLAARRRQAIKNFLLDQRVVAGIGNIYANEILFAVGLHPATPVNEIDETKWPHLVSCTQKTLQAAIAMGGTTIADFVDSNGRPGYFQLSLQVYGRAEHACRRCLAPIQKIVLGGRSTFFCPQCQPRLSSAETKC